jgi:hypothetical protein
MNYNYESAWKQTVLAVGSLLSLLAPVLSELRSVRLHVKLLGLSAQTVSVKESSLR